ncbi:DUF4352 domain-containing protein [Nocardiopsis sp. EMB25]|uniref:DUF4352 domain-containing protein n=1 Tax=Nocardiopsis sp. EMB25 TaxID=2835867 RepID=UPI002283607A|nr:DUF4352 domain-containing protein [Nocardiopsis sp. EMB25]MCY9787594.1 DUF4352 domain-containing protein [Nocardiopsis sp. EMB25]
MSYPEYPPNPQYDPPSGRPAKRGMSIGGRIALSSGFILAFVIIVVLLIAIVNAVTGDGADTTASTTQQPTQEQGQDTVETDTEGSAEPGTGETEGTEEGDGDVVMTATNAGTAGDLLDDTVYTVVDVEIVNNSDESIDVNPVYFTLVLDDGLTVSAMDNYTADIDSFGMVTVRPGNRASGQLAAEGEVTIAQVEFSELYGMGGESIIADVE